MPTAGSLGRRALLPPQTPLLFTGAEESDESRPFQVLHGSCPRSVHRLHRRDSRRPQARSSQPSTSFSGTAIPDPQSAETFEASKLTGGPVDPFCAELIALRRDLPRELSLSADGARLTMRRGSVDLVADFEGWHTAWSSADEPRGVAGRGVPPRAGVGRPGDELLGVLRERRANGALSVRRERRRGADRAA